MKIFTIKQGKETFSVVQHGNNGKVLATADNEWAFVKSVGEFGYEVTDNEHEADVLDDIEVEKIVWYMIGAAEMYGDEDTHAAVIITHK